MKKILIAEDEFLVRVGLKTTLDWGKYGYSIVGEASNGKEALALFEDLQPDILITDVKMPVMDGLALISEARKLKPDLHVIILSNYDDFEYARKAMALGASHYLLKSEVNEQGLLKILNMLPVHEGQTEETPILGKQEYFLRKLLGASFQGEYTGIDEKEASGLFIREGYRVLNCDIDLAGCEDQERESLVKNIESLVQTVWDDIVCASILLPSRCHLSIVCPVPPSENGEDKFRARCSLLVRNAKNYFDLDLYIGVSTLGPGCRLPELFREAKISHTHCFFTNQPLAFYPQVKPPEKPVLPEISPKKVRELLESGNFSNIKLYLENIFSQLMTGQCYDHVKTVYIDLISMAKSVCEEHQIDMSAGMSKEKFSYDNLMALSCLSNVQNYMLNLYEVIASSLKGHQHHYSYSIRQCIEYIEQHYYENITLDDLALQVSISKSYLSMLFKQETDINFINYLTEYRISRAKKLLENSNQKIYEIAEKVGFSSPYYFSKVFKDITGLSCKEYKDRHGKAQVQE